MKNKIIIMLPCLNNLNNFNSNFACPTSWLRKCLRKVCKGRGSASIIFVDDKTIMNLNKQFLQKNRPTDVLSYNLSEKKTLVGEVVISVDTAKFQAHERNIPVRVELLLLCIHGLLHLVGKRDYTRSEKRKMRVKEVELLFRCMKNI